MVVQTVEVLEAQADNKKEDVMCKDKKQSRTNLTNYKITREFSNKKIKDLIINSLKSTK